MNIAVRQLHAQALASLGYLLEYPTPDIWSQTAQWRSAFSPSSWIAGSHVADFQKDVAAMSLEQLEEIYTRTFDMAPLCNPYITAHLYGDENFERGTFMTRLNERYEKEGFSIKGGELPDHLRVILQFAPHFSPEELSEIVEFCLLTPVKGMVDSLKDQSNPYYHLLKAVLTILQSL
jgi:nitrate reductase delta subunit